MGEIARDISTGFIPEEELIELAEPPEGVAVGASTFSCGVSIAIISVISANACPTTACTNRCNG